MNLFVILLVIVIAIVNFCRFLSSPNDPQRRRDFDDGFGGCCMSGESGCAFIVVILLGTLIGVGFFIFLLASD